jgi:cytochrome c biogenesis protein CcmG/thiol:disulfide interchange protein DsbE
LRTSKWFLLTGGLGVGLILGGLILWIGSGLPKNAITEQNTLPKIGSQVPVFELINLEDKKKENKDFLGKPLIINFWASWCGPCKLEMPLLQTTAQKYKSDINLIAVNFEESKETATQFIYQNNIEVPVLLDQSGKTADSFGVHAFPVTFFIDKDGILQSIHIGQLDEKLMRTYLKTIGINE